MMSGSVRRSPPSPARCPENLPEAAARLTPRQDDQESAQVPGVAARVTLRENIRRRVQHGPLPADKKAFDHFRSLQVIEFVCQVQDRPEMAQFQDPLRLPVSGQQDTQEALLARQAPAGLYEKGQGAAVNEVYPAQVQDDVPAGRAVCS